MKFLVVVNQKYIVNVDAQTHGGAEHVLLDDLHYGIDTCQAFSADELKTDTFQYFMGKCETISMNELMRKAEKYKKYLDDKEEEERKVKEYTELINKLETELLAIRSNRNDCLHNIKGISTNLVAVF